MMTHPTLRRFAAVQQQLRALQEEEQTLRAQLDLEATIATQPTWPKTLTLAGSWGSRERRLGLAWDLGLAAEAFWTFMQATETLILGCQVAEDGTLTILTCDGQPLLPKE